MENLQAKEEYGGLTRSLKTIIPLSKANSLPSIDEHRAEHDDDIVVREEAASDHPRSEADKRMRGP